MAAVFQLREVKEQILDIETQIADAKEQKATVEQEINTTEIAVITILDEEWQQDKDNFPKPDFQESLHSAYDRNNPPKDSNDFLSNTLLLLREQFEQELKQKIALIVEKELKQIGAKEDKIKQERAKFDARETRIRKRMDTHPSFLTLWIGHKRILSIDSKVQKLDLQEQQLKEKEKELLKKASELTSGIQTAEKDMQEYTIRALKDSRQENTTRPRPTPFSNNHA